MLHARRAAPVGPGELLAGGESSEWRDCLGRCCATRSCPRCCRMNQSAGAAQHSRRYSSDTKVRETRCWGSVELFRVANGCFVSFPRASPRAAAAAKSGVTWREVWFPFEKAGCCCVYFIFLFYSKCVISAERPRRFLGAENHVGINDLSAR